MSASERLEALAARTQTQRHLNYDRVAALNELDAALPEIVAVVRAAEEVVRADEEEEEQYQDPGYYSGLGMQADRVRPTLAALDEKLGGGK